MENWKEIAGYEKYFVSDKGRVKSLKRGGERILKPQFNKKGYLIVNLSKNGKVRGFLVHRLVAEAFVPNPKNLPEVDHLNDNPADCRADNLEWVTHSENIRRKFWRGYEPAQKLKKKIPYQKNSLKKAWAWKKGRN